MSPRRGNSAPFSLFSFLDIITCVTAIMLLITLMMAIELVTRKLGSPEVQSAAMVKQVKPVVDEAQKEIADLEKKLAQDEEVLKELAGIDPAQIRRQLDDMAHSMQRIRDEVAAARKEKEKANDRAQRAQAEKTRRADDPKTIEELITQMEEVRQKLEQLRQTNRVVYNATPNFSKTPWLVEIGKDAVLVAPVQNAASPVSFSGSEDDRVAAFLNWTSARNAQSDFFMLLVKPSGTDSFRKILEKVRSAGFDVGFDLINEDQTAVERSQGAAAP